MIAGKDSTEVRRGEELDAVALDRYFRSQPDSFHLPADETLQIEQFPGGHSNLTYMLRYGSSEFVLRRPPVGPVAPTAHDMPREFKLLSIIHPLFALAPKPILLCEDTSVIGVPFYLMERRRGLVVRSTLPESLDDDEARRRLSEAVVDALVALHAVDINSSGIVKLGKPIGFVERQVRGWTERWQGSKTGELEQMDEVISWLNERIPSEDNLSPTIVHNDFKLDNLMLGELDPTRIVAVLDWEMCTVGDPLIDVGLFLSYWTMGAGQQSGNSSLRAVTNGTGWLSRDETIDRYQQQTGRNLSGIVFYETFARFKGAVVVQQIYFRFVRGQTTDERFRHFDKFVLALSSEALRLAQGAESAKE